MIPNIADAEESVLLATSALDEWAEEALVMWLKPLAERMLALTRAATPDDVWAELIKTTPEAELIDDIIARSRGKDS